MRYPPRPRQRGLSLIELMVGSAIALVVTAAGSTLFITQLREARTLLLEARLTQELRRAGELVARDLRRAGYSGHAGSGPNPYAYAAAATATDGVSLRYSMDANENDRLDANEQFGFRRRNGAIEIQLGSDNWQSVTDANVATVTAFSVTPLIRETPIAAACGAPLQARSVSIAISATAPHDPRIVRSITTTAQVRADTLVDACPT